MPTSGAQGRFTVEFVEETKKSSPHLGEKSPVVGFSNGLDHTNSSISPESLRVKIISKFPRRSKHISESATSEFGSPPNSPIEGNTYTTQHDSQTVKTFGRNTLEKLPHIDHYRNLLSTTAAFRKRPTLQELHEKEKKEEVDNANVTADVNQTFLGGEAPDNLEIAKPVSSAPKFGWIQGVLVQMTQFLSCYDLFIHSRFVVY